MIITRLFLRVFRYLLPFILLYCIFVMLKNFGDTGRSGKEEPFSGSYGKTRKREQPWDPYNVLECDHSASDDDVRKAYRRLLAKYHPDRFIGMDLDADFIRLASERFSNIQKAYQEICKLRSI